MAEEEFHLCDEGRTFLYIMFIDSMTVLPNPALTSTEVVCRWYVDQEDQANDCSSGFIVNSSCSASPRYCAFLVVSLTDINHRDLALTLTVSSVETGEHLAVCWTNISEFSTQESFVDVPLTVSTSDGEFAHVTLHTAAQQRWQKGSRIVPQNLAYFVHPNEDAQSAFLFTHIVQDGEQADENATTEDSTAQANEKSQEEARELEEKRRKDEEEKRRRDEEREKLQAQEAEDRRRREEEERRKQRDIEDRERDAERQDQTRLKQDQTRLKESQRREIEDRRREEERERHRRDEGDQRRDRNASEDIHASSDRRYSHDTRGRDSPKSNNYQHEEPARHRDELGARRSSMSGRWAEEDRKRLEEEERWRQRQRERDEEAHRRQQERERWLENTARDHQKLEDERERLRQNAKRERAREAAERERRSQERRKQQEITAARLVVDGGFGDSLSSRAVTPNPASHTWNHTPSGGAPDSVISSPAVSRRHASSTASATPQQRHHQPHNNALEHGAAYMEKRQFTENFSESHHKNPHPENNHGINTKTRKHNHTHPPSAFHKGSHVPGLEESDAGGESDFEENHFLGDDVMFEEERYQRRSLSPEQTPATEKKNAARAPHPNRLLASATPARAASRRVANNVAARLEHLKEAVSHNDSFGPPAGLWTVSDAEDETVKSERRPLGNRVEAATGGVSLRQTSPANNQSGRSHARNSGGKSRCEVAVQTASRAPGVKSVLAAALQDVNASDRLDFGQQQTAPVAAAEEGLLRLLLLQKQLHEAGGNAGEHSSALADATAGLVPRMLQVLDVAKNVCETNRTKLKTFCQERDVNIESPGGYLQSQLTALDKLRSQYSTLLPAPGSTHSTSVHGDWQHAVGHNGHIFQPNFSAGLLGQHGRTPMRTMDTESVVGWSELGAPSSVGPYSSSPRRLHGPTPPHLGSGADSKHNVPLDPGGLGPQAPLLRPGGASTPPTAKFREIPHQSSIPALALTQAPAAMMFETNATSSTTEYPIARRVAHRSASPPKFIAASSGTSSPRQAVSPPSEREERSDLSRRLSALQQLRAGARETSLPSRYSAPQPRIPRSEAGVHASIETLGNYESRTTEAPARKRSTSQPQETRTQAQSRLNAKPRGDGYLRILQKLQAHAPATGGLRSKLLDGSGTASRERLGIQSIRALEDSPALSRPPAARSLSSAALGRTRRRLAADTGSDDSLH